MKNRRADEMGSMIVVLCLLTTGLALGDEVVPGIHTFHGIHASLPNDDFEPVRELIGEAPIVALGESYHGCRGFSRLKYRIFRYLVEERGFRAFAFETAWEGADRVDEYVQTCAGTPEEAMVELYGVWANVSVRNLVKWMCRWNHRHPDDRVHFFGFDVHQPARDADALKEYLERFGLDSEDPRVRGIDRCTREAVADDILPSDHAECVKRLNQLWKYFDRREKNIIRRTSREDLEWARIRLVGLKAEQELSFYLTSDFSRSLAARDEANAYIFSAIRDLRFPGIKTAIWAHNVHIQKAGSEECGGCWTMGTHLADALGDDYVALALIAYQVEADRPGWACGLVPEPIPSGSVEQLLHELGEPYLFVDLDFPGTSEPFLDPGQEYPAPFLFFSSGVVPGEQWDGMFFLEHSPMMIPLYRSSCRD